MKTFFESMIFKAAILAALTLSVLVSCEDYEYDDTEIWEAITELQHRLDSMEQAVAANVSAIQSMVSLGSIASWEYDAETGKGTITLLDGKKITVDQTMKGYSLITVRKDSDDKYYWAVCNDGETEFLEIDGKKVPVAVTPALKISEEKEWLISVDGGKTWVSTGILYQEGSSDSGKDDAVVTPSVEFFKDVKQEGDYLVLTLADGTEIKVEIVGEAGITASADTLWFSRAGMEKSAAVEMTNVKSFTITEKPDGWKARIEDAAYLYVTAPENFEDFPTSGEVKVLALFAGGLSPEILTVSLAYERPFALSLEGETLSVTMSEHTGEDFTGYVISAWSQDEYDAAAAAEYFNADAGTLVPYEGTDEYSLADLIEDYDVTKKYVIAAAPYLPPRQVEAGAVSYEVSDIQTVKYNGKTSSWQVADIRYDSATLKAELMVPEYYGGFMELEAWNNYGRDNFLETLRYDGGELYDIQSYDGPANGFPTGDIYEDINPGIEYVIWYIPHKEEGTYTADEFVTYTFKSADISADASVAAPSYSTSDVSASGFTASVTPASGAYKTYSAIAGASAVPETEEEIVRYLIDVNAFSSGSTVNKVSKYSFAPEDEVYLLAVSVTADGGYGTVVKEKVELKSLSFSESLGVEVTDIEYGLGDVTLSLSFTGNPVEITYHVASYIYFTETELERLLALGQMGEATTVKIEKLGGKLCIEGLTVGEPYTLYAVVRDEADNVSRLYTYDFIPEISIDYVMSTDADYEYGMPQLSGTWSGKTFTLDVEMPVECEKYWLFKGNYEYFTGDPWTDTDKLVTKEFMDVTEHTESESGLRYTYMNETSRIYMAWLDDRGEYHAIYEFDPQMP